MSLEAVPGWGRRGAWGLSGSGSTVDRTRLDATEHPAGTKPAPPPHDPRFRFELIEHLATPSLDGAHGCAGAVGQVPYTRGRVHPDEGRDVITPAGRGGAVPLSIAAKAAVQVVA